jgi:GTPase
MPAYETLKYQLARISDETASLLDDAEKVIEPTDEGLSRWKTTCQIISEQTSEETMRVAVVGAIKSGKSTFVNTLFGGDYLKRGAGVVTSIVTRVRSGSRLAGQPLFEKLGRSEPGHRSGPRCCCRPSPAR